MSESEFTAQLIEWLAKLDSREFAVQRSARRSPEVYHFYSRDGSIYGGINLSDRTNHFMSPKVPIDAETGVAISATAANISNDTAGAIPIPPHSLLIFGA